MTPTNQKNFYPINFLKNPKKITIQRITQTWLTSWWGCKSGSVRDLALELELRGNWPAFLDPEQEFGYLNEADLSNGNESPPFCCWCCLNRIAAAKACSWSLASSSLSFLDDRTRVHRLLELAPFCWFCNRFVTGRFFTVLRAKQVQRFPILSTAWRGE